MRSFIAVEAGTPEVEALLEVLSSIKAGLRPVSPGGLHITLKFLGEIEESRVDDIRAAMEGAFQDFGPFHLSLKGVGVFPNLKRPRVVWVGVEEGRDTLIGMQSSLEGRLGGLGFNRERRDFHPHLTLARVKSPKGSDRLLSFMEGYKDREFGRVEVRQVELKKSTLTPRGAIYTTLRTVVL